ncbi:hypothetical protein DBR06_SOUSAS32710003, partial [Sousa chinensis]
VKKHPLKPEALAGIKTIIEEYKTQNLIVFCSSPCDTPILSIKKPHGRGWRFVQDLRTIKNSFIPCHPVVLNPHTPL